MPTHGIDRRLYPRIRADAEVGIHLLSGGTRWAQGVDVGLGGIRFQCIGEELERGATLEVTFTIGGHSATVAGKVVRVDEADPHVQEVALAFLELDPDTVERFASLGLYSDL
ncbi:MAG: PilZ domain-containing protein [Myxococcota bacterium]